MEIRQRDEVREMIASAIDKYHGENVARLVKIEERIIGIDGNGTGREGALQRQDKVLSEIKTVLSALGRKMDIAAATATTWSKRDVIKVVAWVCTTMLAFAAVAMSYMEYHNKLHASEPLFSEHPIVASSTHASVE